MKRSFFHLRNGAETHGRGRESRRRLKATAENLREIIAEAGIEGTRLAAALGGTAGRRLERLAAKSERNIRRLARRDSLWRRLNRWANGAARRRDHDGNRRRDHRGDHDRPPGGAAS